MACIRTVGLHWALHNGFESSNLRRGFCTLVLSFEDVLCVYHMQIVGLVLRQSVTAVSMYYPFHMCPLCNVL